MLQVWPWFQQHLSGLPLAAAQSPAAQEATPSAEAPRLASLAKFSSPKLNGSPQQEATNSMQEVAPACNASGPAPPCSTNSIGSTGNISTVGICHATSKRLHGTATHAADKLSLKTVVDMNSGVCTGELSWHVRLDGQPTRLAVKLSNKHHTRVGFDLQVALRWD